MKKYLALTTLWIAAAMAGALTSGCSEPETIELYKRCSASDELVCFSDTAIQRCVGGWLQSIECGENEFCRDNICHKGTTTQLQCTSNIGLTCISDTVMTECVRGIIQHTSCGEGETCRDNRCVNTTLASNECDASTKLKCASNTSRTTCVNGAKQIVSCAANQVCLNNVCRDMVSRPTCDSQTVLTCASDTVTLQCENGNIVEKPCGDNQICRNNKCEAKPAEPECRASDTLSCASNTSIRVCVNGVIQSRPCGSNQMCKNNICEDTPECDSKTSLNCASQTSYNVCSSGKIVSKACGANQVCKNNKCENATTVKKECDSKTELSCATDTSVNRCFAGKITSVQCNSNRVCRDNLCIKKSDIAGLCDSNTVLSCASETAMNKCVGGKIQAESCGTNSVCKDNKCQSVSNTTTPQVGDPCTIDTCVGNMPYYCGTNKQYFINEEAPCSDEQICEVMDGKDARCLEKCTHENDVGRVCGSVYMLLYSSEATCTRFDDGKLGMVVDESSNNETIVYCDIDCKEGLCVDQEIPPTVEDKGQPCDDTYGYICSDNNLIYCNYYNKVDVVACPELCHPLLNEKDGYCVADETCTPGAIRYKCTPIDEDTDVMYKYECLASYDGTYHYFSSSYVYCMAGTCDPSAGTCEEY